MGVKTPLKCQVGANRTSIFCCSCFSLTVCDEPLEVILSTSEYTEFSATIPQYPLLYLLSGRLMNPQEIVSESESG